MKTFELTFAGGGSAVVLADNSAQAIAQAGPRRVLTCVDLDALAAGLPPFEPDLASAPLFTHDPEYRRMVDS